MATLQDGLRAHDDGNYKRARKILKKFANSGSPRACSLLGSLLSSGQGGKGDPKTAAELYRIAAEGEDTVASYNLAALYAQGRGVEQDYAEALRWYQHAANLGDSDGLFKVALMHAEGQGVETNLQRAEELWKSAAANGNVASMLFLGNLYNGMGHEKSAEKAVGWYLKAAMEGDTEAVSAIDALRDDLQGDAEKGSTEAEFQLGGVFLVFDKDHSSAARWFRSSADKGHAGAQRSLGYLCEQGLGVAQDDARATRLYLEAAEGGDMFAQHNIGVTYRDGEGVEQDTERAIKWLRESAEQELDVSFVPLANLLAELDHDEEAAKWFLKAAEAGEVAVMSHIAGWYVEGIGVQRDLVQAARWYFAMLGHGNGDGVHEVHGFVQEMTQEQIREAARLAGDETWAESAISAWLSG